MPTYSYQLYSSRDFPPLAKTLEMLAELGYGETEGYAAVYADKVATRAALDATGLTMPSGHFSLDALLNDRDGTLRTAEVLGVKSIFAPYLGAELRPTDAPGWTAFGEQLATVGETYRAEGLQFGWHNHDFEFQPNSDGSVPMKQILDAAPSIGWEADIAWIVRGGQDPFQWIADYGDRITAVHVKDIAKTGECVDEDGWADVGYGTLDWRRLMSALSNSAVKHFIVEHDKPNDDARFARRSIEALKTF